MIVLIASECSTPISEVERMSIDKALRFHAATVRLIKARKGGRRG